MSNRRGLDPVDDAIGRAGGAVAGMLITGYLGLIANSARKKELKQLEEQRRLKLPERLESSHRDPIVYYDPNRSAPKKGRLDPFKLRDTKDLQMPGGRKVGKTGLVYTLKLPPKTEWQPMRAGAFMATLLERFTGLALQIEATHEGLAWRIRDLRCGADPTAVQTVIQSFYPQAEVTWAEEIPPLNDPLLHRYVMHFQQWNEFFMPMKRVEDLKHADLLIAMTQEMSTLQPAERIVYSLYVADYARFANEQALNFLIHNPPKNPLRFLSRDGIFQVVADAGIPPNAQLLYPDAEASMFAEKLFSRLFLSFLMVQVDARTPERALALSHFDGHLVQLDNLPYNGLMATDKPTPAQVAEVIMVEQDAMTRLEGIIERWVVGENDDWRQFPLILDARELAALWHLPHAEFTSSRITWGKTRIFVPVPFEVARNQQGICLGYNGSGERATPIYMPLENRTTHTAIIGRTGTGKSTLMHNLIHQDIAAGRGVAVIDPHGTLVHELMERSIPPEREDDVVLLDFAQNEYPPPLNPLLLPEGSSQHDAAGAMMTTIQQIYKGFEGQMADTLYMTLLTLMQDPSPTLRDVTRLYNSPRYRASLAEKLDNPAVEDFWTVFNRLSSGEQEQRRSPVEHRMRAFYGNPALYPVICHPSTLNLAQLIREHKIILVSLEAKRVGIPPRDQQLLGAVLVAHIQQAVMGHAAMEHGFSLYIDEAENFVTTSLPELLSQARFANLSLILANQYLKQLAGDTLDAVMANVGAIAAFQCYDPDARALLPYLRPYFELEDLLNVDAYQAALWMRSGKQQAVMSLSTAPKPHMPDDGAERYERIRAKSMANYTPMSRGEVLTWLSERYPKATTGLSDEEQWYDKG